MVTQTARTQARATTFLLSFGVWVGALLAGALFLIGRYDWRLAGEPFARQGYQNSLYLLIIFLPTLYYTLRTFFGQRRFVLIITVAIGVIFTLPYRWLGLHNLYYYQNRPDYYQWNDPTLPPSQPDWFPQALSRLPTFPGEGLYFGALILLGALVAWQVWRRSPKPMPAAMRWQLGVLLAAYGCILLQTWLHLGLRSPYTYLTHYYRPDNGVHTWYHLYLFPNAQGAVEGDYYVFRPIEKFFIGVPQEFSTQVIRRCLPYYITAQFSYFVNAYYVFLIFNIACWFWAVVAGYLFARFHSNERVAGFMALLIANGPGFIHFAAEPHTYLPGYAAVMILAYLLHRLLVVDRDSFGASLLFGSLLGLASLVYDMFPFYVFVLGYALLWRARILHIGTALVTALLIYSGFIYSLSTTIKLDAGNAALGIGPLYTIIGLLQTGDLNTWYLLTISLFNRYAMNMLHGFFVVPVLLALGGIRFLHNTRTAISVALLFAPSFLTIAYLHYGNSVFFTWALAAMPRFAYTAYPAIYLLAALGLGGIAYTTQNKLLQKATAALPWALIALVIVLGGLDVFGVPAMGFHFHFGLNSTGLLQFAMPPQ